MISLLLLIKPVKTMKQCPFISLDDAFVKTSRWVLGFHKTWLARVAAEAAWHLQQLHLDRLSIHTSGGCKGTNHWRDDKTVPAEHLKSSLNSKIGFSIFCMSHLQFFKYLLNMMTNTVTPQLKTNESSISAVCSKRRGIGTV